jgi:hypothetical protein
MVTRKTPERRYVEKLRPLISGCIEWTASIDKYGNAKFTYTDEKGRHRTTSGHKFGWVMANGPVPEGMKLKNTCGVLSCQNMEHWTLQGDGKGLTLQERYEARFTRLGPDDCWPWQEKGRDKNGYGLLAYRDDTTGKAMTVRATRFGWDLLHPNDLLTPDEQVCHTCDNPPCQNPKHWFKGTNAQNMADMASKGRGTGPGRGEDHYRTTFTWNNVQEIRWRAARGTTQQVLADEFKVSRETIGKIVRNERWVVDEDGKPIERKPIE